MVAMRENCGSNDLVWIFCWELFILHAPDECSTGAGEFSVSHVDNRCTVKTAHSTQGVCTSAL